MRMPENSSKQKERRSSSSTSAAASDSKSSESKSKRVNLSPSGDASEDLPPPKTAKIKPKTTREDSDSDDDDVVGPTPSAAQSNEQAKLLKKRRKILPDEDLYLRNIPTSEAYERSFMHRDVITHLLVTRGGTDFLVTGSAEGAIKFWKKQSKAIEFVKHFRTHLGPIQDMAANCTGTLLATVCADERDRSLKVFDVVNFDMINMIQFPASASTSATTTTTPERDRPFIPGHVEWIHSQGDPLATLAVTAQDTSEILIFDGRGGDGGSAPPPLHTLRDTFHRAPIVSLAYNSVYSTMISVDRAGILEYWMSPRYDYKFPENLCTFSSKLDTDLFTFAAASPAITPHGISVSPTGEIFAVLADDRKVRLFRFRTGKLVRVFDESLAQITSLQQMKSLMPNMEFGRRMAVERELEKSAAAADATTQETGHPGVVPWRLESIEFDASGNFILYPTMLGIKVVNWVTNRMVRLLGKGENFRPLKVALFQNLVSSRGAPRSAESEAADNPILCDVLAANPDPSLFCTAYRKNRFYIFSNREPDSDSTATGGESSAGTGTGERDVFNEKPSREDVAAAMEVPTQQNLYAAATLHTTMGDIHVQLFFRECPRSVENFCVHSKNGYYNGHIFHRVIKNFMVQTGDPTGTGTGGESIWGGEFEDEFHPDLKHSKPYTLSMANAGPNTNGSQFFITVIPCEWLDGKHTVFGRVTRGMEVVQNISHVKTNPKTDMPYNEVKILNISLSS